MRVGTTFFTLCLLSGSSWLLTERQPELLPGLSPVALRSGIVALTFWAANQWFPRSKPPSLPVGVRLSLFASFVCMAGLPTVAIVTAAGHVSQLTQTSVFALVPVFVVFFVSQSTAEFGLRANPLHLLLPALTGVAGTALLLPIRLPASLSGRTWLAALLLSAVLSAFAAVRLHKQLSRVPNLAAAGILAASIFFCTAPFGFAEGRHLAAWTVSAVSREVVRSLVIDGPMTLMMVWLLRQLPPTAFSSRYLFVTSVTIVEGYLLLRPDADWTTGFGLLLLLFSGAWLLLADSGGGALRESGHLPLS